MIEGQEEQVREPPQRPLHIFKGKIGVPVFPPDPELDHGGNHMVDFFFLGVGGEGIKLIEGEDGVEDLVGAGLG